MAGKRHVGSTAIDQPIVCHELTLAGETVTVGDVRIWTTELHTMTSTVSVQISGPIATITFNRPHSLNAITAEGILPLSITSWRTLTLCIFLDYEAFANGLRNIDKNPAVAVTIWQGEPDPPPRPSL